MHVLHHPLGMRTSLLCQNRTRIAILRGLVLGSLPPHEVEPAQIRNPTHTPHFAFFPQGPPVSKRLSSKVLLHTLLHAALGPADLESGIWHLRGLDSHPKLRLSLCLHAGWRISGALCV